MNIFFQNSSLDPIKRRRKGKIGIEVELQL